MKEKYLTALLNRINHLKAFKTGDFLLSSGKKSDFYFDGRLLTLDPEALNAITELFLNIIREKKVNFIGGPATASIPIISSLVLSSFDNNKKNPNELISGFFVRNNLKTHGTGNIIEGHLLEKSRVIIIDDTLTTGNSILQTIKHVEKKQCDIVEILTILDRNEKGKMNLNNLGYKVTSLLIYNNQNKIIEKNL
ncbi:MAG TPA: orotate phosphoribosyltransferase [Dehalococcoidia bacterium]|nr:orotate phosphoribosyltransferase [Dehalococcoidia bacterium]|tara:strand:- start:105 stop:686 length:582 start_codon:yes stop_codon:yes gene_type:complete